MQFFKQSFGDADTAVHSVKEHDQSHMHHTALHPIQLIVSQFDSLDLHAADEDSGGGGVGEEASTPNSPASILKEIPAAM